MEVGRKYLVLLIIDLYQLLINELKIKLIRYFFLILWAVLNLNFVWLSRIRLII